MGRELYLTQEGPIKKQGFPLQDNNDFPDFAILRFVQISATDTLSRQQTPAVLFPEILLRRETLERGRKSFFGFGD